MTNTQATLFPNSFQLFPHALATLVSSFDGDERTGEGAYYRWERAMTSDEAQADWYRTEFPNGFEATVEDLDADFADSEANSQYDAAVAMAEA